MAPDGEYCVRDHRLLVGAAYGVRELGIASDRVSALLSLAPDALVVTATAGVVVGPTFLALNAGAGTMT